MNKKFIAYTMAGLMVLGSVPVQAQAPYQAHLNIYGEVVEEKGVIENGTTFVPVRVVSESFDLNVDWEPSTQKVTITAYGSEDVLTLTVGEKAAYMNKQVLPLETPPRVINGSVYVPIRFIADILEVPIEYDKGINTITIGDTSQSGVQGDVITSKEQLYKELGADADTQVDKNSIMYFMLIYLDENGYLDEAGMHWAMEQYMAFIEQAIVDDDNDGDELTNMLEESLGTDPNNADTDGDGILDGEEVFNLELDPLNPDQDGDGKLDKYMDQEGDGLTVEEELQYGTWDLNEDDDFDGLLDGEEVHKYKTDPTNSDTDGDGLHDYEEIELGFDPLHKDTDGNGILDGDEMLVMSETLPLIDYEKEVQMTITVKTPARYAIIRADIVDAYDDHMFLGWSAGIPGFTVPGVEIAPYDEYEYVEVKYEVKSGLDAKDLAVYVNQIDSQEMYKVENQSISGNTITAILTKEDLPSPSEEQVHVGILNAQSWDGLWD